jgi:hypothetical protein
VHGASFDNMLSWFFALLLLATIVSVLVCYTPESPSLIHVVRNACAPTVQSSVFHDDSNFTSD